MFHVEHSQIKKPRLEGLGLKETKIIFKKI